MLVHRMLVGASCACRIRHEVFFALSESLVWVFVGMIDDDVVRLLLEWFHGGLL